MRWVVSFTGGAVLLAASIATMSCGRIGYDGMHDHVHVVSVFEDRQAGTDTMTSASER